MMHRTAFPLLLGLALALPAAPVFGQDAANFPPVVSVDRWEVLRDGTTILVYDPLSSNPAISNPFAIDLFIHREYDQVTATLRITDANWEPPDPNDPNSVTQGEDVYLRFVACGNIFFAPPEPPPVIVSNPARIGAPFFGRTADEGYQPNAGTNPPFTTTTITFTIPDFVGKNQLRLRGDIDFDVQWFVSFAVSNDESPNVPAPCNIADTSTAPTGVCPDNEDINCIIYLVNAIENPDFAGPNPPPFADAGPDRLVAVNTTVTLDGSRTLDAFNLGFSPDDANVFEKDSLTFSWQWVSGPLRVDPVQSAPTDAKATVVLPLVGEYVYRLTVDDNFNALPSQDSVRIVVVESIPPNRPPRASITGPAAAVPLGSVVMLDGRGSSDPDFDELTFRWVQVDELGGQLSPADLALVFQPLSGTTSSILTWQAISPGRYFLRLLVSDGEFTASATFPVEVLEPATRGVTRTQSSPQSAAADAPATTTDAASPRSLCGVGLFPVMLSALLLLVLRGRLG